MKFLSFVKVCSLALLLLGFISSCEGPATKQYVRNGREYGTVRGAFRHNWWNYYERALSFMEGSFYQEALADLGEAIRQRSSDQRMARTYGMHFIDYFPHRELGLVYYLTEDYGKALREFELSMRQESSAKAQYYLDKTRKILLERQKPLVSTPRLTVNLPRDEMWTKEDPFVVSGTAEDEQYIAKIAIDGKGLFIDGAQKRLEFKKELKLDQGDHVVDIEVENLLGGKNKRSIKVHVDRQGPLINLETPPSGIGIQKEVKGFLYDESGIASLTVDGVSLPISHAKDVSFAFTVEAGKRGVLLAAKDRLGNETRAELEVSRSSGYFGLSKLAARGLGSTVSDAGGLRLAFLGGKKDTQGPSIKLSGWSDEQTLYLEKAYIEAEVRDENKIVELSINGTHVLRRPGAVIFFNHLVELKEGKNRIEVSAKDESGNISLKKITIIRVIPKVFQLESRFSIAVIPFENKGLETGDLGVTFENLFLVSLVDQNRFRVIEREKLDKILQEQKLSRTKLIDQKTALEVGRLVAAQASLIGNFVETKRGLEVVARVIDNESSEVLSEKDVYDETRDRSSLKAMAEGLAIKFHRDFPLVEGLVVQKKGDAFFVDLGEGKVKPQRKLIIYREGEPIRHPVTGKLLGADTEVIGYARVEMVMKEMSKASPIKGVKEDAIKVEDKVLTQ